MTHQEALQRAEELIENDDILIYDVAADRGQIVANVREMKWFRHAVAEAILEET